MTVKQTELFVVYDAGDGGYWCTLLTREDAQDQADSINDPKNHYRFVGRAEVARFVVAEGNSKEGKDER